LQERILDVRGKPCPQPVVAARKVLADESPAILRVIVDNPASAENVSRMARGLGRTVRRDREDEGEIHVLVTSGPGTATPAAGPSRAVAPRQAVGNVVLISSAQLGDGERELGDILMRAFIKTLKEVEPAPQALLFVNSGVWLTTEGSPLLPDLRDLVASGSQVLSCGTCLDYYHLKEKLAVGIVTNMFEIVSLLSDSDRVLRP
jgi:selenium metabolism protein YedF